VRSLPRLPRWLAAALASAGLVALYLASLRTGFLNDDYLFLEEAQQRALPESLTRLGALGNYYRPLARQIYYAALEPLGGGPLLFHLINFAVFLAALALLADLLRTFLPRAGVMAGLLFAALVPLQRVNLTWVSCSQDLLALAFTLGAFALYRRQRNAEAAAVWLLAALSKESALPAPLAFAAWTLGSEAAPSLAARARRVLARGWPFVAALGVWLAIVIAVRARNPGAAPLEFAPAHFFAGYVHLAQALLGLDHPAGLPASFARHPPAPIPLLCFAALAMWLARAPAAAQRPPDTGPPGLHPVRFALVWLAAFGLATGPVAGSWSAYYYTLCVPGAALLVGWLLRRVDATGWLLLAATLTWWHAAGSGVRAFAIADRPWGWTSHLTSFYFQRAAALTDTLARQLRLLEPSPPPRTRFFFATLPPWAGFQMGNGALIRWLYGDATLESWFYSQFSESTAADHPCRFLYWDGRALQRLHAGARDPFFQVGSDLLLFDRLDGAAHAFRRGLAAGEFAPDHLYWLGWAELWRGRRDAAERAWAQFGAVDDTARWFDAMRRARMALYDARDTLATRRWLAQGVRAGIGRPEAHAVLGDLLIGARPKYGMLELKVARTLKPDDWVARRELAMALVAQRLDDVARRELEALAPIHPDWRGDTLLARARAELARRRQPATVTF
jgi:hypothetical protein